MGNLFLRADEVQQILGVSKSYAYKVINLMTPKQQWKFSRTNRTATGHSTDIVYTMVAGL